MIATPWKKSAPAEPEASDRHSLAQKLSDLDVEVRSDLTAAAEVVTAKKSIFAASDTARIAALRDLQTAEIKERSIRTQYDVQRGLIERLLRAGAPKEVDDFAAWARDQQRDGRFIPAVAAALQALETLRLEPDEAFIQTRLQELAAAIQTEVGRS